MVSTRHLFVTWSTPFWSRVKLGVRSPLFRVSSSIYVGSQSSQRLLRSLLIANLATTKALGFSMVRWHYYYCIFVGILYLIFVIIIIIIVIYIVYYYNLYQILVYGCFIGRRCFLLYFRAPSLLKIIIIPFVKYYIAFKRVCSR